MKVSTTFNTIHPGDVLRDELETRGVKQKDFASTIGMPASVLNDIIKGKRSVTPDIAILLEASLGKDASSWLRLQAERDLEIARKKEDLLRRQKDIEIWQSIQDCCNVSLLEKYLPNGLGKSLQEKISTTLKFFKADTVEELKMYFIQDVNPSYFRRSDKYNYNPVNIFTWKHLAYNKSETLEYPRKFSSDNLIKLSGALKTIFYENKDTMNRLKVLLQEFGIRFLILESEKGTHIDGFSFWKGDNPTITLTLRYQRIDNLAFTLMHEIYHVFYHLNKQTQDKTYITISDVRDNIEEQEADIFANNFLIPSKEWQLFKERNEGVSPYAISLKIREFARQHQIHPAIVLGRYQHDYNVYDNGRGFDRSIT